MRTAAGVDVHVPRAEQEPFHATLAVVSGAAFPAVAALAAVTGAVPPGTWTGPGGAPVERLTNQKICDEFKIPQRKILCTNQPVGRVLRVDGVRRREFLIYAQA